MKKLTLLVLFIGFSNIMSAQKFSAIVDIGYRPNFEKTSKIGLGAQFKYKVIGNFCLATDFMAYIPKTGNGTKGIDVGFTIQYFVTAISDKLVFYPLAGLVIVNHSFEAYPHYREMTEFGFNFGVGVEFRITKRSFINADFKYFLLKKEKPQWYDDYGLIRLGYGFRF